MKSHFIPRRHIWKEGIDRISLRSIYITSCNNIRVYIPAVDTEDIDYIFRLLIVCGVNNVIESQHAQKRSGLV